jgi:hypothetical protein
MLSVIMLRVIMLIIVMLGFIKKIRIDQMPVLSPGGSMAAWQHGSMAACFATFI